MNGFALGLGLKRRLRETRKWAIDCGPITAFLKKKFEGLLEQELNL